MMSAFIFFIYGHLEVSHPTMFISSFLYEISGNKLFYLVVLLELGFNWTKAVLLSKMVILTPHITPIKEERLKKRGQ